ncbi:MAG: hypothetical protein E6J34_10400 [Chloroflexi bacterium]|nr:MAG: hypothetical protein E6J34_10400 [Chloroflexota bacterium]
MLESSSASFLADLTRCFKQLDPTDDATRSAIADLLGLHEEDAYAAPRPLFSPIRQASKDPFQPTSNARKERKPSLPAQTKSNAAQTSNWLPSTLELLSAGEEKWDFGVSPLPMQSSSSEFPELPLEPLFVAQWTRGILSATLSTTSDDGPLDIERIVASLAQNKCQQQLPRLPQPTLRRGVQLLIDKSDGLVPFSRDQRWLQDKLLHIVGPDKLEILRFIGSPLRDVGPGPKSTWSKYQPPLAGTVVLLLTDFGIGQPMFSTDAASISEWLDFAQKVQRAGCPLVAFVPYAPDRWPYHLRRCMAMIQWDRKTNVSTVRRLIGPAHEVKT